MESLGSLGLPAKCEQGNFIYIEKFHIYRYCLVIANKMVGLKRYACSVTLITVPENFF